MARSKDFKAWFGDWEKVQRIEKLKDSEPVCITGEEYNGKYELNRKSAKDWMKKNLRGEYINKDTGEIIEISRVGINEVTSHNNSDEIHLKSLFSIPYLLENSIFIEEIKNLKNDKYDKYRYYVVGLNIGGVDYTAKVIVGVKQGRKYYDHRLTKIEKGKLLEAISPSGFTTKGDAPIPSYAVGKDKRLLSILQIKNQDFKDWFGDREKVLRIEKLKNSEPVSITGEEYNGNDDLKVYKKNSLNYGKSIRGNYTNKDTGDLIYFGKSVRRY